MKKNRRVISAAVCVLLIAAMLIPMLSAASVGSTAWAEESTVLYQNDVFTKRLYKTVAKIGFGSDGSMIVDDRQTIRKVYGLLAGMRLKAKNNTKKNTENEKKAAAVAVVLYKKDGSKKTYTFTGDLMRTGKKTYTIKKNNPAGEIREIFETRSSGAVVKAKYPKVAQYPNEADYTNANGEIDYDAYSKAHDLWWKDAKSRRELTGYADGLDRFLTDSTKQFLSEAKSENRIYSPLNVYMALGMLAELTDGSSRQQILDLLGSSDIQSLRRQASALWNANYINDGLTTSILAGSVWLDKDIDYHSSALETLAQTYYASAYQGEMGSDELNHQLQEWLNEQTGGLLEQQASEIELNPETVLALATTIYFRAKWHDEFYEANTKENTFHTPAGDVNCEFMNKEKSYGVYYWGDSFSAVSQSLEGTGSMWFLLPEEGVSVDELLSDAQAMDFLLSQDRNEWKDRKNAWVNLSVPKFDVSSMFGLKDGLQALGVTDVFYAQTSDFSPMTSDLDGLSVTRADHAARVAIDEKGVTAAAFTVIGVDAAGAPLSDEEVDFVLDRPFLFAVTGTDGMPLFVGVVNQP